MSKVLSQTPDAIRKRAARARASGVMELVVVAPAVVTAAIDSLTCEKVFTFVGYGVDPKGRGAVRFTNDKRRTGTLLRGKFTSVKFVALPKPMTKEEILASEFVAQVMPAEFIKAVA
jgi:hypothetical protein